MALLFSERHAAIMTLGPSSLQVFRVVACYEHLDDTPGTRREDARPRGGRIEDLRPTKCMKTRVHLQTQQPVALLD